jgi:hypothetical protein
MHCFVCGFFLQVLNSCLLTFDLHKEGFQDHYFDNVLPDAMYGVAVLSAARLFLVDHQSGLAGSIYFLDLDIFLGLLPCSPFGLFLGVFSLFLGESLQNSMAWVTLAKNVTGEISASVPWPDANDRRDRDHPMECL